jgi:hypothetical protein
MTNVPEQMLGNFEGLFIMYVSTIALGPIDLDGCHAYWGWSVFCIGIECAFCLWLFINEEDS